jgi:hypothetical protein
VNDRRSEQTFFDFRTGRETALQGAVFGPGERSACSALNRRRAQGIQEATRDSPSRQSYAPDAWAALVEARSRQWGVPLIDLAALGISHDADDMLQSSTLRPLKTGAEACPFADDQWRLVYKLFPLFRSGGLGKTFEIEPSDAESFEMFTQDATLLQTMEKLMVLHDAGACPTEIVGLDYMFDYLVVKQPLASAYLDFEADRQTAVNTIHAVPCKARFKRQTWILWEHETAWIMSDLHYGNIMRDAQDQPTIIDALLAPLPPELIKSSRLLTEHVEDARALRLGLSVADRKAFDDVCDDDL